MRVKVMAVYLLNLNCLEVYEAGAALIAWLAYPGASEEAERAAAHAALCNHALRIKCVIEPDWMLLPQWIQPIYTLHTPVKQDLNTLQRRLRDRMAAGRMAIGFLKEALTGQAPELPTGVSRVSINEMSRLVMSDTRQTDPGNVETRIWRQSLPVIHIASAFQVFLQLAEPGLGRIIFERFLLNRRSIECVVRAAEFHASIIARSGRIPIDLAQLVELRLAEGP
jgi:hypothetical protein